MTKELGFYLILKKMNGRSTSKTLILNRIADNQDLDTVSCLTYQDLIIKFAKYI